MPRINLLPVRAARQAGHARRELIGFALVALITVVGLYVHWASVEHELGELTQTIQTTQDDIHRIEQLVAKVDDFKSKSSLLERKLEVIEALKRKKVGPAKMLSDMANILTAQDKIWLISMEENNGLLVLKGGAMEQENIGAFEIALERDSKFFRNITLSLINSAHEGGVPFYQWTLSCRTNYAAS